MANGSFIERRIDLAIRLASDTATNQPTTFAESGTSQVTLSGHRASVRIENSGGLAGNKATATVWGLSDSLMQQLSTLGMVLNLIQGNTLTITAGNSRVGMSTVFVGTITQAYADYNSSPDVPFKFECLAGASEMAIPYPSTSYQGMTSAATILSAIATAQNWGFENGGVTTQLSNPYFSGSAMDQVRQIAAAARINAELFPGAASSNSYLLAIWPRYGNRPSNDIPLIAPAPDGQMINYPSYTQQGIILKTIYDPRIVMGGQVRVRSSIFTNQSLTKMNNPESLWNVAKIDHALDCILPKGQWMSSLILYNAGAAQPLPPRSTTG